jgi:epoxyqueuosine reductase
MPGVRREQGRFREDHGLTSTAGAAARAVEIALAAGFHRAGIVDPRLLATGRAVRSVPDGMEWDWITSPSAWSSTSTILVCCLSCRRVEPDDLGSAGDPHALVAPFARAHYYREAVRMLAGVAGLLERDTGIPRAAVRLFSNSRIPEKPLLEATGLAAYGRNGCAIAPGLGSLFVIAGAVLPVPTSLPGAVERLPDPCGACRACRSACPAAAIDEPFVVRRDRCLQAAATSLEVLDDGVMERWGTRLYGCHACQEACPHNRRLAETARPATGEIGPSVSLRALLSEDAAARRRRFRGTALGMSWVPPDALLRNALVAAGNKGDAGIRGEVERHLVPPASEPVLRAARWALDRL